MMLALAERFVARGVQCDLVIAINKGQLLDQIPEGVRMIKLGKKKTLASTFALANYLRRERPQVLLSTIFSANITAMLAAMMAPRTIRVALREADQTHIVIGGGKRIKTWANYIFGYFLYHRAYAVIAVSDSVKSSLIRTRLARQSAIHVIRNPASPATVVNESRVHASSLPLVLACGRLEAQKDYTTLLRAFTKVRKHCDARLAILGEGSLLETLQRQARDFGIDERVSFVGFSSDPQQWMYRSTVFVHSSRHEGMSNVLMEALTCGCAIVATDCPGGTREILADGKYGTLVPVGDDNAMATAIIDVLQGKMRFPNASEHLRKFDIEVVTDTYLKLLFPQDRKGT